MYIDTGRAHSGYVAFVTAGSLHILALDTELINKSWEDVIELR